MLHLIAAAALMLIICLLVYRMSRHVLSVCLFFFLFNYFKFYVSYDYAKFRLLFPFFCFLCLIVSQIYFAKYSRQLHFVSNLFDAEVPLYNIFSFYLFF